MFSYIYEAQLAEENRLPDKKGSDTVCIMSIIFHVCKYGSDSLEGQTRLFTEHQNFFQIISYCCTLCYIEVQSTMTLPQLHQM